MTTAEMAPSARENGKIRFRILRRSRSDCLPRNFISQRAPEPLTASKKRTIVTPRKMYVEMSKNQLEFTRALPVKLMRLATRILDIVESGASGRM